MDSIQLREHISKILIKWHMPTRQVAISEIMAEVKNHVDYVIGADWEPGSAAALEVNEVKAKQRNRAGVYG